MYKKCLGAFVCSKSDCNFGMCPITNHNNEVLLPTSSTCKIHFGNNLLYVLCPVRFAMNYPDASQYIVIEHFGFHTHAKPPKLHPSTKGMK